MTLYRETPCEHGETQRHRLTGMDRVVALDQDYMSTVCPGGSREEVTIDKGAAVNAFWAHAADLLRPTAGLTVP